MIAARLDLVADLLSPHHVGAGRFQVLQIEHNISLVAAQLDVDGEVRPRAFLCRIIDTLVDAPNNVAQQAFLFLENSLSEHTTSLAGFTRRSVRLVVRL